MHMLWYVWENCNKGKQKKQSKHYFNKKKNPCTLQDIINANCQRYCRGTTKTCVPAVVQKYYIYKIFACFFNFIIFYHIQQKHNLYIYKAFVAYLQSSMLKVFTLYTMMIFPIKFILKSTSLEHLNKIFFPYHNKSFWSMLINVLVYIKIKTYSPHCKSMPVITMCRTHIKHGSRFV